VARFDELGCAGREGSVVGDLSTNNQYSVFRWNKIIAAYTAPSRKYHNLVHLQQMFQHYDANKDALTGDRYACAYAIFFHEFRDRLCPVIIILFIHSIVYDATAADNKNVEQSVETLKQFSHETTLDQVGLLVDTGHTLFLGDVHLHTD
jgi:predicted metal-dependent HD superfamily phosphohydrolase